MKLPIFGILLTSSLLVGCATNSENQTTLAESPPVEKPVAEVLPQKVVSMAEAKPDDIVCKRTEVTGSHIRRKICVTKDEWDGMRTNSQEFARQVQSRPITSNVTN